MDGKHLLSSVAFHYQRYLRSGIRKGERERPLKLRIEMTNMCWGVLVFQMKCIWGRPHGTLVVRQTPNEMHMKGQVILGLQGKIITRYFLSVFQFLHYKMGIIMVLTS